MKTRAVEKRNKPHVIWKKRTSEKHERGRRRSEQDGGADWRVRKVSFVVVGGRRPSASKKKEEGREKK